MEGEKLLFYGESGSGKTVLCSTAVDDSRTWPALMLDSESGTKSIKSKCNYLESMTELGNPIEGKLDVLRARTWDDVVKVYDKLYDMRYKFNKPVYKSLILDSTTELTDVSVDESVKKPRKTPREIAGHPDRNDYGTAYIYFKKFIRAIRDIDDLHLIFTCLLREREIKELGATKIVPEMAGARSTNALLALVDYGGILEIEPPRGERLLTFKPTGRTWAKWRVEGVQGPEINGPTITKIFDAIGAE